MKVLLVSPNYPYPPNKGDRIRSYSFLESLIALGHDVDLICCDRRKAIEKEKQSCKSVEIFKVNRIKALCRCFVGLLTNKSLTTSFFSVPRLQKAISSAVLENNYDRILVLSSGLQGVVPKDISSIYFDLTDIDSVKWSELAKKKLFIKKHIYKREALLVRKEEERILRNARKVSVISENEKKKINSNNLSIIKNIILISSDITLEKEKNKIVFTGQMDYEPNVNAVRYFDTKVMPLIKKEVPSAKFIVAGRNPSNSLRTLCKDSMFTGEIDNIHKVLASSAVAVVPLKDAFGVPNKILEAFSLKVPVVASSEVKDVVEGNEDIALFSSSAKEFADNVIKILRSPNLSRMYTEKAYSYCLENHSIEKVSQSINKFLS